MFNGSALRNLKNMIRFPYIQLMGKLAPIIPIKFKTGGEWGEFKAYVDSGASYSIFHMRELILIWSAVACYCFIRGTRVYIFTVNPVLI